MKKESARSLRLTPEALIALKTLTASTHGKSQGDIASAAIVEKANNTILAPVIRFGVLDPQQLPHLQLEASLADRRLRELSQQILRIRPKDKSQADKLSATLAKVDTELEETRKLRIALAKLARLGSELTADDQKKVTTLINWSHKRIENAPNAASKDTCEFELKILEAFLPH